MAEIVEGWVNLDYAARMNASSPDMNAVSPGRPYFVDPETAVAGQWVRLVFRTDDDRTFWCVGLLDTVDEAHLRAVHVGYENGDPAPDWFGDARWIALLDREPDGNWALVELEEMADPDDA